MEGRMLASNESEKEFNILIDWTTILLYMLVNKYVIYTIYHKSIWVGFYKYFLILIAHWAAKAPSTTLWSADTIISITYATLY